MSAPKLRHRFLKSELFKRQATGLDAWEDVDDLKLELDNAPESGDVIPGGEGLRKIRMSLPGRGKRGGARVVYYQVVGESIFLITVYAKNEQGDLSHEDLRNAIFIKSRMLEEYKEPGRD